MQKIAFCDSFITILSQSNFSLRGGEKIKTIKTGLILYEIEVINNVFEEFLAILVFISFLDFELYSDKNSERLLLSVSIGSL
ncbi:MAG: hypothetical protein RMJ67_08145 [Elusimicrobiota bacterium]|nr:hypothetical protein [Endomicrobiia bacterium]MCX7914641.1 hypothetical protein [Thermodesulfovibrionales bacterium]MDW8166465.1 hypothetical protein [Elusimicrobiota bacterium]